MRSALIWDRSAPFCNDLVSSCCVLQWFGVLLLHFKHVKDSKWTPKGFTEVQLEDSFGTLLPMAFLWLSFFLSQRPRGFCVPTDRTGSCVGAAAPTEPRIVGHAHAARRAHGKTVRFQSYAPLLSKHRLLLWGQKKTCLFLCFWIRLNLLRFRSPPRVELN